MSNIIKISIRICLFLDKIVNADRWRCCRGGRSLLFLSSDRSANVSMLLLQRKRPVDSAESYDKILRMEQV